MRVDKGAEEAQRRACGEYSWRLIREAVIANDIHWHKNEALGESRLFLSHIWLSRLFMKLAKIFCSEQARSHGDHSFWSPCWCTFSGANNHACPLLEGTDRQGTLGFHLAAAVLMMNVSLLLRSLCVSELTDVSALRRCSLLQQTTILITRVHK